MENKNWPVIEVSPTGKKGWENGGYTLNFVYSNKGNFLVKGYVGEVNSWLKQFVSNGGKYFMHRQFFPDVSGGRHHWYFWKDGVYIANPRKKSIYDNFYCKIGAVWTRFEMWGNDGKHKKTFKRFPNRWIPEFDQI